jgi:signal peptidase I
MRRMGAASEVVIAIAVLALAGCGNGGDKTYRIPSPAMAPAYDVGDHIKVDTDAYKKAAPERGDVIVFHPPTGVDTFNCGIRSQPEDGHPCARPTPGLVLGTTFIKRVVGLPGEQLFIRNNRAYVNGRALNEPYIKPGTPCENFCNLPKPIRIPQDHYFTLGDNRGESADSRGWGPVPRDALIGKVVGKD